MPPVASVSQRLLDLSIKNKLGLARYETWVVQRVIALLNAGDADLEARLSKALDRSATLDGTARLAAIRKELLAANLESYQRLGRFVTNEMRDLVVEQAGVLADHVEGALPFKFSVTRPSATLLKALVTEDPLHGRLLGAQIDNLAGNRAAALMEQLQIGTLQGENWGQILTRIRGTAAGGYRDGVLETIGRRQAEVIGRTAVMHFTESARDLLIQENADLFSGTMWIATLDPRTCKRCAVRADKVWDLDHQPVGHSYDWLGGPGRLHHQDRCTGIPILKDFSDLRAVGITPNRLGPQERAALDHPVPITTDYEDWLRDQPLDVQADALSSQDRAQEFRDGAPLEKVWNMRFDRMPARAPERG